MIYARNENEYFSHKVVIVKVGVSILVADHVLLPHQVVIGMILLISKCLAVLLLIPIHGLLLLSCDPLNLALLLLVGLSQPAGPETSPRASCSSD